MPNWFNEQKNIFAFLRENVETEMTVKGGIKTPQGNKQIWNVGHSVRHLPSL